jgi:hypothetical protein
MKKRNKLGLKKVTLRDLDDASLGGVAGGTQTYGLTGGCNTCAGNSCQGQSCVFNAGYGCGSHGGTSNGTGCNCFGSVQNYGQGTCSNTCGCGAPTYAHCNNTQQNNTACNSCNNTDCGTCAEDTTCPGNAPVC